MPLLLHFQNLLQLSFRFLHIEVTFVLIIDLYLLHVMILELIGKDLIVDDLTANHIGPDRNGLVLGVL